MTRLPLRAISVLLLSALMLPGCSSVKPMLSGSERKKRKVTKETPARIESHAPESCPDESQPIGDIDELGEKHADAAPVLLPVFPDKNRPEMTFGDLESANVRIPLKYNNPFPSSGELVLPLGEHENEFCYPYPGKLISPFGYRGSRMHIGIDIKAVPNDTVRAALPGVVRMSKYYSGYGNLVLIRHYNGIETVYAHNSKNLVRVNDAVEAGDPIALAGRTGRATTEHVHFEVRIASEPFNPTLFVDPDNRSLRLDRTIYCYNRGGKIRISTERATGFLPGEENSDDTPKVSANASSDASSRQYYYVKKGDTLSKIARQHSTTVSKLCALNGIKPTKILQIKEKLRVR